MPLLQVTGGPIAPSGKVLAAGTRLIAIYDKPYVDGIYSYPTNHFAELDLTTGGWKPQGTPDETVFYLPGGADTFPLPPRTTLHEVQIYDDGTQQSFIRGPMHIIETAENVWFYPTPAGDIKYLDNPSVPAMAVMQSEKNQPNGVATLDGSSKVIQRLAYEGVPGGVAGLDAEGKLVSRLAYEGAPGGVATLNAESLLLQGLAALPKVALELGDADFLFGRLASALDTIRVRLDELGMYFASKIVESGSNANGEYVRFADGTQICRRADPDLTTISTASGAVYSTTSSWTYPAAFIEGPTVLGNSSRSTGGASWGGSVGTPGPTSVVLYAIASAQNTNARIQGLAIGRWK